MSWTEIATAPFLTPAGASLSVRLSVRAAEEELEEVGLGGELGEESDPGGELDLGGGDGGIAPVLPAPVAARVVTGDGCVYRVAQPDAHVLAEHAPAVVECSLLGLAPDALAGLSDADVRLDVRGTGDRLLYRGNVRAEDVRPGYGLGVPPLRLFAYDGVERLAAVPFALGAQGLPAGALTLAETAAELLAPLGHDLPVVTLLGWQHTGQRTDLARARSIRADVGRWAVSSSSSDEPSYRDALKAFLVAFDLQLVQHVTPATAPGGGGAVWLVVQRSLRTEALRVAAGGGTASAFAAAWVTGAPSPPSGGGGAWTVADVAVQHLGLASVVASGVSVGPSVPRPWPAVARVASQHPTAQPGLVDEDMTEIAAGTGEGGTGGGPSIPPRPRWWQGVKLSTGVATPAQIVKYAGEGDAGVFLGFGIGQPDAVYQQTVRWYAPGTALEIQIRKRTGSLAATGAKTSLRFGVVIARTPGFADLYLQPPTAPNVAPAWGTAYSYVSADVETPTASTSGPVDCRVVTAALPRAAQIVVFVIGHAGRENSALAVSASVEPARGTAEVLGVEAAWPSARTSSASPRGRDALLDVVGVGDLTGSNRGTAALSVQAAGGGWTEAASAWRAAGGTGTAAPMPVARVVDVAEQVGTALAGMDVLLPRVCLTPAAADGLSAVPWAAWLEWAGGAGSARRLPACVETNLVTGACRVVAYPLASGGVPASAVSVYRYSRDGSVGPVEPPAPPAPPTSGDST